MEIVKSSDKVAIEWNKHNAIVAPLHMLKEGESLKIEESEKTLVECEHMARIASIDGFQFAVVNHGNCFEIAKLPPSTDLTYFNNMQKGKICKETNYSEIDCVGKIKIEIAKFKQADFSEISASFGSGECAQRLKADHIITYSYLQRRIAANKHFKNHPKGATGALKECLDILCKEMYLEFVPKNLLQLEYESTATAYRIL